MTYTAHMKKFPLVGQTVGLPKQCPGNAEHAPHLFYSHGLVMRVEEERGFIIVLDDHDLSTDKLNILVDA